MGKRFRGFLSAFSGLALVGALLAAAPAAEAATTGTIQGYVNTTLNRPISGVRVVVGPAAIPGPGYGGVILGEAITDSNGRYRIPNLPKTADPARYAVVANPTGAGVDCDFASQVELRRSLGVNFVAANFYLPHSWSGVGCAYNHLWFTAAGDSFTSGEGNPPFIGTSSSDGCHRSGAAYSTSVIAPRLDFYRPAQFIACSGATIADMYNGRNGELPQMDFLVENGHRVFGSWSDLVTLTIGGNDVGFGPALAFCAVAANCESNLAVPMALAIQRLGPRLVALYKAILTGNPTARLVVAGYPRLFSNGLNLGLCEGFDVGERAWANGVARQLDHAISDAVASAGGGRVVYADTYNALNGHELCTAERWVNGVFARHPEYSFHPNASGQGALGEAVWNAFRFAAPT